MRRIIATATLAATTAVLAAAIGSSSGAMPLAGGSNGSNGLIGCCTR